jgi:AhpD family alkylhydroperoxidase
LAIVSLIEADQAPLLARAYYADGDPGPIVAALAQVPEVLEVAMPFIATVLGPSSIPARAKELVILRTSALLGCRYCVDAHTATALDIGFNAAEVRALRGEQPIDAAFTEPAEFALLSWVDGVAAGGPVDAALVDELKRHVPDHHLVELTLLVGATMMLNRFCTTLELPTATATLARVAAAGMT